MPSTDVIGAATGITFIYKSSQPFGITYVVSAVRELGIPHQSISVLLNILFTLMIIARLMLHGRGIRDTLGPSASICGWNKDIVTVLTESFALFTVTFLLFVAPWAANNSVVGKSFPILIEIQVRLITGSLRSWGRCRLTTVTNRSLPHSLSFCVSLIRALHRASTTTPPLQPPRTVLRL